MIDKALEAINAFHSYLRAVLNNPDTIDPQTLNKEATNYLNRNPHVKDNIDLFSLVGAITERIDVKETINFGITIDDKGIDHKEWYEKYLNENLNERPFWKRFYNYCLSTGLSSVVMKGIDTTTDQILSKCENPNRPGTWSNKGLVVGVVQGGKTTNMIGLCNKAIDAGYKLIIIIPGLLEDLRLQTHERFDAGLIGTDTQTNVDQIIKTFSHGVSNYDKKINVYNFTTANNKGDNANNLNALRISKDGSPSIVIVKKNTRVLNNLLGSIYLKENAFKEKPVLIIDDESDLASINTKRIKKITNVLSSEITKTPNLIRALLSFFDKSAYIGYTATPYANIFQHYREEAEKESTVVLDIKDRNQIKKQIEKKVNLGEGLFPKNFICSLPVYSNYIGFEKMFGDNFFDEDGQYLGNRAIKTVNDYVDQESYRRLKIYYDNIELPKRKNPVPDKSEVNGWMSPLHSSDWSPHQHHGIPESLKEAICFFIIGNIVKKIRKIKPIHNSMLINVSTYKDTNESVSLQVQEYLNNISSEYGLGDNDSKIRKKFQTLWNDEFKNVINEKYIYPSRKIIWDEIANLIPSELRKIQTLLITGDNDYLKYTKYKSVSVIAVGAIKLSRGITLEGLSVSYFLKKSVTSSADTVTQMGRWFGYRPRYDDICRLYLSEFLLDDFREYYEAEEDLRSQLLQMDRKGLTPTEFGLKIRMKKPTAPNKMIQTKRDRIIRNFSGKLKQLIFINIKRNSENVVATKSMFEKLKLIEKNPKTSDDNSKYWENIESDIVVDFLSSYKSPLSYSRFTEDSYIEYINTCNELGSELSHWNIALVSNKSGHKKDNKLIGLEFIPKNREYEAKVNKNARALRDTWNGDPNLLCNYSGEDEETYRIRALTERSHLYLDMGLNKNDADKIIKKEKLKFDKDKDFQEATYWKRRRKKPILIIYPFKTRGDKENKFIYISYAIIFPYSSNTVQSNYHRFSPVWETYNPVLIDQQESYRKFEARK